MKSRNTIGVAFSVLAAVAAGCGGSSGQGTADALGRPDGIVAGMAVQTTVSASEVGVGEPVTVRIEPPGSSTEAG